MSSTWQPVYAASACAKTNRKVEMCSLDGPPRASEPARRQALRFLLAAQFVGNPEPADLDDRLLLRRPDVQALHAFRAGNPVRIGRAHQRTRRRAVEVHAQRFARL